MNAALREELYPLPSRDLATDDLVRRHEITGHLMLSHRAKALQQREEKAWHLDRVRELLAANGRPFPQF